MSFNSSQLKAFQTTLKSQSADYGVNLSAEAIDGLSQYYEVLQKWNKHLHLVAPCSPSEFAERHILESLMLLPHLPIGAKVADIGSGGGLPILPCLVVRDDLKVTLIEASKKKAVFLREALIQVERSNAIVVSERFEQTTTPDVGFVTGRALEQFADQLSHLFKWAPQESTLMFFGGADVRDRLKREGFTVTEIKIPNSERRFLFIGTRG